MEIAIIAFTLVAMIGVIVLLIMAKRQIEQNVAAVKAAASQVPTIGYRFDHPSVEKYYTDESGVSRFPFYGSDGAVGFDIMSIQGVTLAGGQTRVIDTGVFFDIPEGYELQVRSRSGLAAQHSISVLNSPGTIDPDYTGMLKVILHNSGERQFKIVPGMRIAQVVFSKTSPRPEFERRETLTETARGESGLGSTGV